MKIERIELILVSIPLKQYFETSFGKVEVEKHIVVKMYSEGLVGYGESALGQSPSFSGETIETAWHIQKDFLIPLLLNKNISMIDDFINIIKPVRHNHFAKCGLEGAFWYLLALKEKKPVYKLWGGTQSTITSGVSIGIQETIEKLLERIEHFFSEGYKRIKIKIKPGWDIQVVKSVREKFGDIPLMVDANAAYTMKDLPVLKALDECNLMMIEQPLHFADLTEHAELQKQLKTPICLDESINGFRTAQAAMALESCRIVNIKPGRVGGYFYAKKIHNLCLEHAIPVWCGGMLEFGIGRAFNVALCTLPNFVLPGDVSSSSRYYDEDIIYPPIELLKGELKVPEAPAIGYEPDEDIIYHYAIRRYDTSSQELL
jgi:O-succinylbenzoate synthase